MKKKVIIYGASSHGAVVCDSLERSADFEIVGFFDTDQNKTGKNFFGYKIIGGKKELKNTRNSGVEHAVIAIGDNTERKQVVLWVQKAGFNFISAIHPSASISKQVRIGEGTVVMAGAIINANSVIGSHVIINSGVIIEHDCLVDSFAHIASGAHFGGSVQIGEGTLVGTGATVRVSAVIGKFCTVGVGAVVIHDVPDGITVVGNPARPLEKK